MLLKIQVNTVASDFVVCIVSAPKCAISWVQEQLESNLHKPIWNSYKKLRYKNTNSLDIRNKWEMIFGQLIIQSGILDILIVCDK